MGSARDSQRSAVYTWERKLPAWPGPPLSLPECQQLVARVWNDHLDAPAPHVTDGRSRRTACYVYDDHQIRLPRWSRSLMVVLHETAHAHLWAALPNAAGHGPEYARLYLDLLERYAGVDPETARWRGSRQRPRRVRFAPPEALPMPRDRVQLKFWY
ncbi:MAG: hypothetical protein GKS06_00580 [Acidobacteria bacterium]|nr:hypothetical protein [Acidobacteriota bacterium]